MHELLGIVLQWGPHRGPHAPPGPHWGGGAMAPWGGAGGAGGAWFGVLAPLLGLLLLAAVVVGVLYLSRSGTATAGSDRAIELLRERYARGEVSDEEFERRAARLSGDADGSSTAR